MQDGEMGCEKDQNRPIHREASEEGMMPEGTPLGNEIDRLRAENKELLKWVSRMHSWLLQQAVHSEDQANCNRGRFNSLADACVADAKNYRAMATDARSIMQKAKTDTLETHIADNKGDD